jgi:uncharacterized protein (DUF2336 family)
MAQDDLLLEALGARTPGGQGRAVLRPALLRALTELFVGARHHYPEEIRQFQEISLLLLETADETLRGFVAESLVAHRDAPPRLLERLVQLGGSPAAIVLSRAVNLPREPMALEAAFGAPALAAALANRSDLDSNLIALLGGRGEIEILVALVANPAVPIEGMARAVLIERATGARPLARRLIERLGPSEDLTPLFQAALPGERAGIILANRRRHLARPDCSASPLADAKIIAALQQLALAQARNRFANLLARALGLPAAILADLVDDPYGEPLALCLGALRVPTPAATRIFLFIDPRIGQSVERVRSLLRLVRDVPAPVCRAMLAAMTSGRRPGRHQALHDQDAAPLAARPGPHGAALPRRISRRGREMNALPGPRLRQSTNPDRN